MKTNLLRVLSAIIIIYLLIPFSIYPGGGAYNPISNTIWCKRKDVCIHETGHKLDDESGWISHTQEFSIAVQVYLIKGFNESPIPPLVFTIMETPGLFTHRSMFLDHNSEIYANIFQHANGKQENMPEIFWKFYDWKRAEELMEQIVRKYGED